MGQWKWHVYYIMSFLKIYDLCITWSDSVWFLLASTVSACIFTYSLCFDAVAKLGLSIAELQVGRVRAAFVQKPFETSVGFAVHSLLVVDALQMLGHDYELLVASHHGLWLVVPRMWICIFCVVLLKFWFCFYFVFTYKLPVCKLLVVLVLSWVLLYMCLSYNIVMLVCLHRDLVAETTLLW